MRDLAWLRFKMQTGNGNQTATETETDTATETRCRCMYLCPVAVPSPLSLSSSLCRHFLHFATFLCRAHKSSHTAPPVNPAKRRRIDSLAGVGVGAGVACTWQVLSLVGRQHVPIARTTVLVSQCELWRIGYKSCFRCACPLLLQPLVLTVAAACTVHHCMKMLLRGKFMCWSW